MSTDSQVQRQLFLRCYQVYRQPAQQMVCALPLQHVQKNPWRRLRHLGRL